MMGVKTRGTTAALLCTTLLGCLQTVQAAEGEFDLSATLEGRYFFDKPLSTAQDPDQTALSVSFEPEYYLESEDRNQSFTFAGFLRYDEMDDERSHADVRELFYHYISRDFEWRVGVRKVFWGKTESVHLVDIINQTDAVENLDGEDKLGQPMVNLAWITDFGTIDFFVLPYFRERTFAGPDGRMRPFLPIDFDHPIYEDDDEEKHIDGAIRYANSFGAWDVGLSYFRGTGREPRLLFGFDDIAIEGNPPPNCILSTVPLVGPLLNGLVPILAPNCEDFVTVRPVNPHLVPAYDQIEQTGLELQYLAEGWFLKLEGIHVSSEPQSYTALAAGFEYTWGAIFDTALDFSLVAEYLYDDRGSLDPNSPQGLAITKFAAGESFTVAEAEALAGLEPTTYSPFQDDAFIGTRWAFNDVQSTEMLAGVIVDLESDAILGTIEASRRLGSNWKLSVELRTFSDIPVTDPLYSVSEDSHLRMELTRYF